MGDAKHFLGAAWREARKRKSDVISAGIARAEAADAERVRKLKQSGSVATRQAKRFGRAAARKRNELTLHLATTSIGAAAGRGVAKLGGKMSAVPVLSLPSDVFNERNGINELAQRLQNDPDDPLVNLVLAESMSRMQREMLAMAAARSLVTWSPTALLMREVMKTAGAFSRANELPVVDKLLKRAYGLAMTRLRVHPGEPASLHVIARVYLAKRNPQGCLKPALLGVSGRPKGESGPIFYTMSRAYQALRDKENARLSAQAAIDDDFTLGWLTLAELVYDDPDLATTAARRKAYLEDVSHVEQTDLVSYAGIAPQTADVVRNIYELQKSKTLTSYAQVNESVKRLQGNVAQLLSTARSALNEAMSPPDVPEIAGAEASMPDVSPAEGSTTGASLRKVSGTRPEADARGTSDG